MKKQPHKHLSTYYAAHRCSAEDTQDLYLGFEELKPVLSILNKIQIEQKKLKQGGDISEYLIEVDSLKFKLETLLLKDVKSQLEKEKK